MYPISVVSLCLITNLHDQIVAQAWTEDDVPYIHPACFKGNLYVLSGGACSKATPATTLSVPRAL